MSIAAEATLDCAKENGAAFDKAKTEAMFLAKQRKKPHGIGADRAIELESSSTNTPRIWIDSKMALKKHHSARMKNARKVMYCIRCLLGQLGMCPDACRRTLVACVQVPALYGREGSGV